MTNIPTHISNIIKAINDSITSIRNNHLVQDWKTSVEWNKLDNNPFTIKKATDGLNNFDDDYTCQDDFENIVLMDGVEWNQNEGFNDAMPWIYCENDDNAKVGCVPLAIGQVMRYHEYPSNIDWHLMDDKVGTYTTAWYLYNIYTRIPLSCCVVGPNKGFDCNGTWVLNVFQIPEFFKNNYGYSNVKIKDYFKDDVVNEIRNNRPVLLSAGSVPDNVFKFDDFEGHMWVCDGFIRHYMCLEQQPGNPGYEAIETIKLNMLWGWSNGNYNGYYSSFLVDGTDFNFMKKMIYNIKP